MKLKALWLGLAMSLAAIMPANAQRGGGNWELLGEERVGIGGDRDVINLRQNEDHYRNKTYRRLRFQVEGGDVRMQRVRLNYMNGHSEVIEVGQNLRSGQNFDLDLRGERSHLKQIEMNYASKFGFSLGGGGIRVNQASVKVFGEIGRNGPPPEPPRAEPSRRFSGDLIALGRQSVGFGTDRDVIRVEQPEGWFKDRGFDRLHFKAEGNDINLVGVRVAYLNGHTEDYRVDRVVREGSDFVLDLPGERSFIKEIEMMYRARPNFRGRAVMSVFGEPSEERRRRR
jgi:hypothetical protein